MHIKGEIKEKKKSKEGSTCSKSVKYDMAILKKNKGEIWGTCSMFF